ncbi:MAG: hypothetical protein CMJ49_09975 [Planctomycetaceae bacterium]|nr:hypothetical protein [Planctomycetaceae bacterium]
MIATGIRVLTEDERDQIHAAALRVLDAGGVAVEDNELRAQLTARGATPGRTAEQVRIPSQLVAECLETVNRAPVLQCVNGKTLKHGPNDRYYSATVTDPYIVDAVDGIRRPALDDIARHARLCDALPLIDHVHLMDDTVPDLDSHVSELKGLEAFVANTTTAYHCAPGSLEGTRYWIEIAEIMAGGSLERCPILNAYVPSVSPLTLTDFNTRQLRMFLEHGVLCQVGPCAIAGATAPYPVAGLVVQSWAEVLAMVVAAQVIKPGAPIASGGGGAHPMDMRDGASLYSGVSKALASAAMVELGGGFDLPTLSGNLSTLCSNYTVQNGIESAVGAFGTFFGRVSCYGTMGSIANACGMSATQIVLHHDLIETLENFRAGIDVTDEKLAVASILDTGPKGDFLTDPLTLRYMHSDEHFFSPCLEVCAAGQDQSTMTDRATRRAEDLIATHEPTVPQDRVDEVRRYVERELKALG